MNTASTASQNIRETANDASEGVRAAGKVASKSSAEIESDLQTLRDDIARLGEQIGDIVASTGTAAWRRAKAGMDDAMSEAQDKGREAVSAVREVSDHFVEAIDESIKTRPYTTLAIVAGLAFLFGATWRR
jgi:ElaB/YqjD/DUF883 family membrane-anchored ribosome-binding protein